VSIEAGSSALRDEPAGFHYRHDVVARGARTSGVGAPTVVGATRRLGRLHGKFGRPIANERKSTGISSNIAVARPKWPTVDHERGFIDQVTDGRKSRLKIKNVIHYCTEGSASTAVNTWDNWQPAMTSTPISKHWAASALKTACEADPPG
jgi:hypothetical protein